MSKTFKASEVAEHKTPESLWIVVDEDVYDVTKFADSHPGGKKILQRVGGKDASKQFWKYHNESILNKYKKDLLIGSLDSKVAAAAPKAAETPKVEKKVVKEVKKEEDNEPLELAGSLIPFGDPAWYQGYFSPYYNETHVALRNEVRAWVEEKIEPGVNDWDKAKTYPSWIYEEMGSRGYLAGLLGLGYPTEYTPYRVAAVPPEKWDLYHEFIVIDELCRTGSGGFIWNIIGGYAIGLPPVLKFGSPELRQKVLPDVIQGKKRICLAITEPDAGSDVANITCEAKKTPCGKFYIVNGEKKWITNGVWSDWFTVAVRTGGPGMGGVSVLIIPRGEGVTTRQMDCMGVHGSGTTYVTFEDVKVPVENLVGKENQGFKVIMMNFNHERMGIIIQCTRFARVCYEEAMKYANKRKTFGKKLIEHPVIRMKLAQMARQVEATHNWLENMIYQCAQMGEQEAALKLGGAIAGLKAQSTVTFEFCAREAVQIFGGLGYTQGGQGAKVERLYRDVRGYAIPGGSEEIMLDLSIRQSMKVHEVMGMKL
ncbi:acyl-CoA dehydrogenase/oxidase [Pyronema omphalodes]|nr:acyl-CoA dehydrogenase/oxidase [Pyronema omphalodes]